MLKILSEEVDHALLSTEIGLSMKDCFSNEVDISVKYSLSIEEDSSMIVYLSTKDTNSIISDPSIESYLSRDGGLYIEGWISAEDDHAIEYGIITVSLHVA